MLIYPLVLSKLAGWRVNLCEKNVRPSVAKMSKEVNNDKRAEYMDSLFQAKSAGRALIWTDETNFKCTANYERGGRKLEPGHLALSRQAKGQTCIVLQQ